MLDLLRKDLIPETLFQVKQTTLNNLNNIKNNHSMEKNKNKHFISS